MNKKQESISLYGRKGNFHRSTIANSISTIPLKMVDVRIQGLYDRFVGTRPFGYRLSP